MIRVVLDTNVLVSALLSPGGAPARLVTAWLAGAFELVVCPMLVDELTEVLRRRAIARFIGSDEANSVVEMVRAFAVHVDDPAPQPGLSRDPGDDFIIALARAADAAFLVSGDRDVLDLELEDVRILSPRRFLDALG